MTDRDPKGFSTRAIRAASRTPIVNQRPTSVPIYQTATFTAADAEELGDVVGDARAGYAVHASVQPDQPGARATRTPRSRGEKPARRCHRGWAPIHAALGSMLSAGDRVVAPLAAYGSTRKLLSDVFARFGVGSIFVDMTDNAAVAAAIAAAPTKLVYAETIANPTIVVADHARSPGLAHGHGATYVVDNTFASPYLCRPIELGADLVIESATKCLGWPQRRHRRGRRWSAELVRRRRGRPDRHRRHARPVRRVPRPARHLDAGRADGAARRGPRRHSRAWLERQDGVIRVLYPGLPSHPQHEVAVRQFRAASPAGCSRSRSRVVATRGTAFIDALTLPELTASLGSVHTMVVHPPSTTQRQLTDAAARRSRASGRACCACRSGSRTSRTSRPTSTGCARRRPRRRRAPRHGRRLEPAPWRHRPRSRAASAAGAPEQPARPARPRALAPADVGRLRGRPDHLPRRRSPSIGMTLQQLPDFAFRSPADYATAMDDDPRPLRPGPRAGHRRRRSSGSRLFRIFRSPGSRVALVVLVVSIVVCTLDRTPRLWRDVSAVRVVQPEPFFDPRLPDRAAMTGVAAADVAQRHAGRGFHVRESPTDDGTRYLYGDRHQYTKLATLFTHLGLILFLVAAAVTTRFGDEQGLVVPEGGSLTVQAIGTPRPPAGQEHRLRGAGLRDRQPADFTTDLAVYQNGRRSPARRSGSTTRSRSGATRSTRTASGRRRTSSSATRTAGPLWDGQVPMTTRRAARRTGRWRARPRHRPRVPARRDDGRRGSCSSCCPYRIVGRGRGRPPTGRELRSGPVAPRRRRGRLTPLGISARRCVDFGEYTLLIAKRDPGRAIVWAAFAVPDHRHRDLVLPAAAADLGPARLRRPARRSSSGPIATSTSSASSARCSTTSSRSAVPARPGPRRRTVAALTTLHDLHRALFPIARPVGAAGTLDRSAASGRSVGPRPQARVPAFDALESGDLAIIPGPALAVVAPGPTQIDDLAVALARARVPAVAPRRGRRRATTPLEALGEAATDGRADRAAPGPPTRSPSSGASSASSSTAEPSWTGAQPTSRPSSPGSRCSVAGWTCRRRRSGRSWAGPSSSRAAAATRSPSMPRPICRRRRRPSPATSPARRAPARCGSTSRHRPARPGAGGRLILLGDEPPNELERIAADRIAALLALELARDAAVRQAREETRRGDPLPADGPPWVVMLARQAVR